MSPLGANAIAFGSLNVSWPLLGDARRAKFHEHFSLGREFENLVPFAVLPLAVGNPPHVVVRVDTDAMWKYEHPAAKIAQQFAALIEFENGIELRIGAGAGDETLNAAPFDDPDMVVLIHRNGRYRPFQPSLWPLVPARDRAIRIRR